MSRLPILLAIAGIAGSACGGGTDGEDARTDAEAETAADGDVAGDAGDDATADVPADGTDDVEPDANDDGGTDDAEADEDVGPDGDVEPDVIDDATDGEAGDAADAPPECVPEGESGPVLPEAPGCCPGLATISCATEGPGGICGEVSGVFCCSYCGDGACGPGENRCNCFEDCPGSGTCVEEGGSFAIVPGAPDCCPGLVAVGCSTPGSDGGCMPCSGASYCTNCGDGVCGTAENVCRCPSDCT